MIVLWMAIPTVRTFSRAVGPLSRLLSRGPGHAPASVRQRVLEVPARRPLATGSARSLPPRFVRI